MTGDPDPEDLLDNQGVETDCQNRFENGKSVFPTSFTLSTTPVSGKGYLYVLSATNDATCAAGSPSVNTLAATFTQTISQTGSYGLCTAATGNNAATYVVRLYM